MSGFTPGPWVRDGRYILGPAEIDRDGDCVRLGIATCAIDQFGAGDFHEMQLANARLIAAAPELAGELVNLMNRAAVLDDEDQQRIVQLLNKAGVLS